MNKKFERLKLKYENARSWFITFIVIAIPLSIAYYSVEEIRGTLNWINVVVFCTIIFYFVLQTKRYQILLEFLEEEENLNSHFVKIIDYAKGQDWRTDVITGLKGAPSHGHIALSGSRFWYIEDEEGNMIVKDGKVVENT